MRKFNHPVTPAAFEGKIEGKLASFCKELVPNAPNPIFIDYEPIIDAPSRECFPIVAEKIEQSGGDIIFGWALWEMPEQYIEAEFHAVWRKPDGTLLDVAPKDEPTQRILFLPDQNRQYEGFQVNNRRIVLRNDPNIDAFFQACDKEFELLNRGDRLSQHGEITLTDDEAIEYDNIQQLKMEGMMRLYLSRPAMHAYSPCWCGSGKKNRWCHKDV